MNERGQSMVETVLMAPIVVLCCLLGLQGLAAGANYVAADNAAHAGALAGQLGRDPRRAARTAVPGWSAGQVVVRTSGRRVRVRLKPRSIFPMLAGLLVVDSEARYTKQ
ncbi:MAG: pilus assembly protein [Thermoleophilaceae bacterium]|nr:pilus assembly protein [Thermoleophilaceae bacterium]